MKPNSRGIKEKMRTYALPLISVAIIVLIIFGCTSMDTNESKKEKAFFNDLSVTIDEESVTPTGLSITMKNDDISGYIYGDEFALQRLNNGSWNDVPYVAENVAFYDIGHLLSKNESKVLYIDWDWCYGILPAGTYRLCKEFFTEGGLPSNFYKSEHATSKLEFTLSEEDYPCYSLMLEDSSGELLATKTLSGEAKKIADDIIFNYLSRSSAFPSDDISSVEERYLLRATNYDGTETDYYAYMLDGHSVMQTGSTGLYSVIDYNLYKTLTELITIPTSEDGTLWTEAN